MKQLLGSLRRRGSSIAPDAGRNDGGQDLAGHGEDLTVRDGGRQKALNRDELGAGAIQVNGRGWRCVRFGPHRAAQGRPLRPAPVRDILQIATQGNANTHQNGDAQTCHPIFGGHLFRLPRVLHI